MTCEHIGFVSMNEGINAEKKSTLTEGVGEDEGRKPLELY